MSTVERQHELEQNALADWIVQLLDVIRTHLLTIIGGCVAAFAGVAAWLVISAINAATEAQSWEAYLSAIATGEQSAFNEVARRYPGSDAALWSQLVLADLSLTDGAVLALEDRSAATERLESAVDLYSAVLAAGPDGLLVERATFGLAKANEALGNIDEAQAGYASVAKDYPDSALAVVAQEHADALASPASKDWYDWFFAQNLAPAIPPLAPGAGSPAAEEKSGDEATSATDALFEDDAALSSEATPEPAAQVSESEPAVTEPATDAAEPAAEAAESAASEPAGTP